MLTVLPVGLVLEDREYGGFSEKGGMPVQAAGADKPGRQTDVNYGIKVLNF